MKQHHQFCCYGHESCLPKACLWRAWSKAVMMQQGWNSACVCCQHTERFDSEHVPQIFSQTCKFLKSSFIAVYSIPSCERKDNHTQMLMGWEFALTSCAERAWWCTTHMEAVATALMLIWQTAYLYVSTWYPALKQRAICIKLTAFAFHTALLRVASAEQLRVLPNVCCADQRDPSDSTQVRTFVYPEETTSNRDPHINTNCSSSRP